MSEKIRTERMTHTRPNKRAFSVLVLEITLIFAVPAFLVLGAGVYLHISTAIFFTALAGAFILSWIMLAFRIRHIGKS